MHIKKSQFLIAIMDSGSKNLKNLNPTWISKNLDFKTLHVLVLDF